MAKLDRLLNLTAALLDTSVPLTAEEIRTRVPGYTAESDESFRRTFERDKDDLREMGIPVETVTVEHHEQPRAAYRISRDAYELADPGFEPEELAALHLAATTVRLEGLDPDDAEDALRKLGGLVADGAVPATAGELPAPGPLLDLFVAVVERREAAFDYGDRRRVHPLRLQFQRGRWYLIAHDLDREDRRTFRLDRIEGSVETGPPGAFEAPDGGVEGVHLRPWEYGTGAPTTALVLVDAEVAPSVLTEDPTLSVRERREDGSVVLELAVRDPAALRSFVLSMLDRAELLAPESMRADLVAWLSEMAGSR